MRKFAALLIVAVLAGGGYLFHQRFEVVGLDHVKVVPRDPVLGVETGAADGIASHDPSAPLPPARQGETIRVASFNIQVFGTSKMGKPDVIERLAHVVRQFDVVAIQEIRSKDDRMLPRFVEMINAADPPRQYGFVIGERQGRTVSTEQYAFVYDRQTIEIDPTSVYSVPDPEDRLHRPPLVGLFRARGPPAGEAFTFQLINIHTDPDETKTELNALDDVYKYVRDIPPDEDDVILLGDLNVDHEHLGEVAELPYVTWTVSAEMTNTRRTKQYDNIVFNRRATVNFTGTSGVYDLVRELNITTDEALKLSDHLPVWAEFSVYELGPPGRLATRPDPAATTQ